VKKTIIPLTLILLTLGLVSADTLNFDFNNAQTTEKVSTSTTSVTMNDFSKEKQVVEGYSSIVSHGNSGNPCKEGTTTSYRSSAVTTYRIWCGNNCWSEWKTGTVPDDYTSGRVTFMFTGDNGYGCGDDNDDKAYYKIKLDGSTVFDGPKLTRHGHDVGPLTSDGGTHTISWNYKDCALGDGGVYYLTVPASEVTPGSKHTIWMGPGSQNCGSGATWDGFTLHAYTDTASHEISSEGIKWDWIGEAESAVGTYISKPYDMKDDKIDYDTISWAQTNPANTDLTVKFRAAKTQSGLSSESWRTITSGSSLNTFDGDRWIQIAVDFKADNDPSPNTLGIDNLHIDYTILPYTIDGNGECSCDSCDSCEAALNDATNCGTRVKLTEDITSPVNTCIEWPANGMKFDCQEHKITGDGVTIGSYLGIHLPDNDNNQILNCVISGFRTGIFLSSTSSKNTVSRNTLNSNGYGIRVHGNTNTVSKNTLNSNEYAGLWLAASDNIISENTMDGNTRDGVYMSGAYRNTISKNTITNNGEDGIDMSTYSDSSLNEITDNTINLNNRGIGISSSHNTITGNTIEQNSIAGIYINQQTLDITINSNTVCDNGVDIEDAANSNNGSGNTGCSAKNWQDDDATPPYAFKTACQTCSNPCECDSCSSCEDALNNPACDTVTLTTDITDESGSCIVWTGDNKVFDGGGHTIDGTGDGSGIALEGATNNEIKNFVIKEFQEGIKLSSSSESNRITLNTLESNTYGVYLDNSNGNTIEENTGSSNIYGFYLQYSSNCQVTGNNELYQNTHGIFLHNMHTSTVSDNTIKNNLGSGIHLQYSTGNTISGNTLESNKNGIYLQFSSNQNTLSSNQITKSTESGIVLEESTNNNIEKNEITENKDGGIYLSSSSDENKIKNSNKISKNTLGIWLVSSSDNEVKENEVNENIQYGIMLEGSSDQNEILRNTLNDNLVYGLHIHESSSNTVESNTINNNRHGIWISRHSTNNGINNNEICGSDEKDIHNEGESNSGASNTGCGASGWTDTDALPGGSFSALCPGICAVNQPPNVVLNCNPTTVDVSETVTCDPTGTTDPDGDPIVSYEYTMPGGNPDSATVTDTTPITTKYSTAMGTYEIFLMATDDQGKAGTASPVIITTTSCGNSACDCPYDIDNGCPDECPSGCGSGGGSPPGGPSPSGGPGPNGAASFELTPFVVLLLGILLITLSRD